MPLGFPRRIPRVFLLLPVSSLAVPSGPLAEERAGASGSAKFPRWRALHISVYSTLGVGMAVAGLPILSAVFPGEQPDEHRLRPGGRPCP